MAPAAHRISCFLFTRHRAGALVASCGSIVWFEYLNLEVSSPPCRWAMNPQAAKDGGEETQEESDLHLGLSAGVFSGM